ncbi:LON peptidase substrate-binding domain-containing protein [Xinfangfangia sp. CPCC 101601]|uniref:LON peptidase substrate-binding domain-containing protein n=1 Tax=Pseudogemmobacter lacusdianii TaxID=3069608 RepID=A0ABU0VWZ4_9RHOB|nr:LON peptidase substrate-binding domain-containing protein [Xinfangfangia sp. CPCC 101601]MDQ2066291.1 LON peptidase substrate-binding domain-containing protein [Xinfangfangia sp. CPCC 101601]
MMRIGDLPQTLAVFPLSGALLLPRARLPLHIFEPRYLAMIEDCMKTPARLIGMVQPRAAGGDEALQAVGCAGRLVSFAETDDGRYMVTLQGISRFRILGDVDGFAPYRRCAVDWSGYERDTGAAESDPGFEREGFMALLARYFASRGVTADWDSLRGAEPEMLINALSQMAPFSPEDRQALLEAPDLTSRRKTLQTLIEFALLGGDAEDIVQ